MSSARRALAVLAAIGTVGLSGCVSTQQRAAWLRLENARAVSSQRTTLVRHASPLVRLVSASLVVDRRQLAISVRVANPGSTPLIDVPLSVGVRPVRGPRRILNSSANLPFFANHVPVIPPGREVTWVLTLRRSRRVLGRPFALAGSPDGTAHVEGALPRLSARVISRLGRVLRVRIENASAIPQPELQIYVFGRHAAGAATLAELEPGASATADVPVVGGPSAGLHIEVLPTMYPLPT